MDQYGRQKKFGIRGRGTDDNAKVGGVQQSDPSYFELRPQGVIYETFAHMGNDCFDACEEYYNPQFSACNSASGTSTPCPPYCSGFATCTDGGWVDYGILDFMYQCNQYTYYCNPGGVGDAFNNCIQNCPPSGGGYAGPGGRFGGTGRNFRKGGRIRRRR